MDYRGKEDQKTSHLVITIAGIVVICYPLKNRLPLTQGYESDLLLSLPAETQLTLARDAIEFTNVHSKEARFIQEAIKKTISEVLEAPDAFHPGLLMGLYLALKEWEMGLPIFAQGRFSSFLSSTLGMEIKKRKDLVPVPYQQYPAFRFLHESHSDSLTLFVNSLRKWWRIDLIL